MVATSPFTYVTDLSEYTEGSSSHVIMRCGMSFSTSHNETYTLPEYAANISSTRSIKDQRRTYVTRGDVKILE